MEVMSVAVELEVSLDIRKKMVVGSSEEDEMKQRDISDRHDIVNFEKSG